MGWKSVVGMLRGAAEKWQRDDCLTIGASVAYYALFSFFPLILVILSVVGFVVDPSAYEVRQQLVSLIGSAELRELVTQTLEHLSANRVNTGLIGFATLILGASGFFAALDRAFDIVWDVHLAERPRRGIVASAWSFTQRKLISFALVLGAGLLLLLSILSTVLVTTLLSLAPWLAPNGLLLQGGQLAVSGAAVTLALMAIYKYLPSRPVAWGDVWLPALAAAMLLAGLQKVAGIYLGLTNYASYGAVGGVMALLAWLYLSCLVILLGAELSYAYARTFGSLARAR